MFRSRRPKGRVLKKRVRPAPDDGVLSNLLPRTDTMDDKQKRALVRISEVFPWHYQILFMVLEPSVIFFSLFAIPSSPTNHFYSLAPSDSIGPLFTHSTLHLPCTAESAWHTPQLRSLWYVFMSALAFSAVIEPLVLHAARYNLRDVRDAEEVIKAVLLAFAAFDIFHAGATISVTGARAVIPGPWADVYAMVNVWVPVAWFCLRVLWFAGIGRRMAAGLSEDEHGEVKSE